MGGRGGGQPPPPHPGRWLGGVRPSGLSTFLCALVLKPKCSFSPLHEFSPARCRGGWRSSPPPNRAFSDCRLPPGRDSRRPVPHRRPTSAHPSEPRGALPLLAVTPADPAPRRLPGFAARLGFAVRRRAGPGSLLAPDSSRADIFCVGLTPPPSEAVLPAKLSSTPCTCCTVLADLFSGPGQREKVLQLSLGAKCATRVCEKARSECGCVRIRGAQMMQRRSPVL